MQCWIGKKKNIDKDNNDGATVVGFPIVMLSNTMNIITHTVNGFYMVHIYN